MGLHRSASIHHHLSAENSHRDLSTSIRIIIAYTGIGEGRRGGRGGRGEWRGALLLLLSPSQWILNDYAGRTVTLTLTLGERTVVCRCCCSLHVTPYDNESPGASHAYVVGGGVWGDENRCLGRERSNTWCSFYFIFSVTRLVY